MQRRCPAAGLRLPRGVSEEVRVAPGRFNEGERGSRKHRAASWALRLSCLPERARRTGISGFAGRLSVGTRSRCLFTGALPAEGSAGRHPPSHGSPQRVLPCQIKLSL